MKINFKKVIKVGLALTVVYLFGRSKGVFDVCEKYNDQIGADEVSVGLFGKSEKPGRICHVISKIAEEVVEEATDAK